MHKKITLITGLLALLALPHVVNAQNYDYIPSTEFFSQFATPRTAESLVEQQQARTAERRTAAQQEFFAAQEPQDETLKASAGEEETQNQVVVNDDPNAFLSPQTLATLRALERIEKQRQEAELRSQALSLLGADAASFNLHSGAPLQDQGKGKGGVYLPNQPQFLPTNNPDLAPTGAGSYVAFFAVLIAAAATVVWSKKYLDSQQVY